MHLPSTGTALPRPWRVTDAAGAVGVTTQRATTDTKVLRTNPPVSRLPDVEAKVYRHLRSDKVDHEEFAELGTQPANGLVKSTASRV